MRRQLPNLTGNVFSRIHTVLNVECLLAIVTTCYYIAAGLPPIDYKLVSVIAVIRHGNRLPMPHHIPFGPLGLPKVSCHLKIASSTMPELLETFIGKNWCLVVYE